MATVLIPATKKGAEIGNAVGGAPGMIIGAFLGFSVGVYGIYKTFF
jgi:hypothetical protein